MAQINLRDYLNGVEELIDSGQIEEALAHCRHILKIYPKHVDTYRMLGKAYLEAKRHGEASDIFQRVLSSTPDDFVAHVGMSIIREDESNLDAAIWHMERAFESQPSNRAVQDELRRLYGEREGFEPPKVRLTRGALARMYAHGDLYAQAISELRSALSEDPQRPDLQVLLARMYYLTNRKSDAIEVCTDLLDKLPYCLYANHLMADILTEDNHPGEAKAYRDRVGELDPYEAQITTLELVENVAADSVMVEHMVISGPVPRSEAAPRSWTGALEPIAEPESYVPEELPDWLAGDEDEEEPGPEGKPGTGELVDEYSSDEPGEAFEIAPEERRDSAPAFDAEADEEPAEASAPAEEIPGWLRELRPADGRTGSLVPPEGSEAPSPSDTQPHWAQEFDEAGFEPTPMPDEDAEEEMASSAEESMMESSEGMAEEEDDGLAWLEGLAAKQGAGEDELMTEPEEREEDKPDWLKTPEEKAEEAADSLSWLDEMAAEVGEENLPETPAAEEASALIEEEHEEAAAPSAFHEAPAAEEEAEETVPQWLRDLGQAAAGTGTGQLDQSAFDQPPDWLDELRPSTDELENQQVAEDEEEDEESWEEEASSPADLSNLDWLEELGQPKQTPTGTLKESDLDWESPAEDEGREAAPVEESQDLGAWVPESQMGAGTLASNEEVPEPVLEEMQPEPEPAEEPAPEPKANKERQHQERLEGARTALNGGNMDAALEGYAALIKSRKLLDDVITDLQSALRQHDEHMGLWQTLGDAYMRDDRLGDALDCYTKAEDLL